VSRLAGALSALALLACAPPERPACDAHPAPGALGSICGFDHPEDLQLVAGAGVVVASGLAPGAGLFALALDELDAPEPRPWRLWPPGTPAASEAARAGDPTCTAPPAAATWLAHGLAARPDPSAGGVTLAVVGHGEREAIELFALRGSARSATLHWRGCVPLPPDAMGNDVALAPDGELIVTKFIPRADGAALRYQALRASVGFESGEVLAWRAGRGWRALSGTRGAGPNGLELSPDGEQVFFAENGRRRVVRVPRAGASAERPAAFAALPSNVDNVSWNDGRLLAVVHKGGVGALFQACLLHWAVWEVDPVTLDGRELLDHRGEVLCGATSALRVADRLLIGSMNEARIGVWRPAR
jgi:hypothetical protein